MIVFAIMHQTVRLTIFCNNNTTQPHIVQLREVLQGRLGKYILNNKEKDVEMLIRVIKEARKGRAKVNFNVNLPAPR